MATATTQKKSIEERYKKLDEIEHILHRSGMYVGSTKNETRQCFVYDERDSTFTLAEAEYCPALLKLCDEAISNTCDEFRRDTNLGLTELHVTISTDGTFRCRDNGGIPVVMHKDAGVYLPEMLFSQLRTSSNYDDTEARDVVGTNGVGAALIAIFSEEFTLYAADGKKSFRKTWRENIQKPVADAEIKRCSEHFTDLTYKIDFSRFGDGVDGFTEEFADIVEKRCIDAAAANPGLKVTFTFTDCENDGEESASRESVWQFSRFEDYIELYSNYVDPTTVISTSDSQKQIYVFPDGNINIGFVNGAECSQGTHIKAVHGFVNEAVAQFIEKKKKMAVIPKNVDDKYSVFVVIRVDNPAYDSQTKDCLTTPVSKFDLSGKSGEFSVPKQFLDEICKSDIVDTVIDWLKKKEEVEDEKTLRKLNKQAGNKVRASEKYIPCHSKDHKNCELYIYEGYSAGGSHALDRFDAGTQAGYLLRGVILNTATNMTPSKIMANRELSDLVSIIGLKFGHKTAKDDLNFGKIIIASDMDYDGNHIAGLLILFFATWFPELFEYEMIYRVVTPIIIAKKGVDIKYYYSLADFNHDESNVKGYEIRYIKGLGGLTKKEKVCMMSPTKRKLEIYSKDSMADQSLNKWMGKGKADVRKSMLTSEI